MKITSRGQSLIQVLIATAILGILMYAMMQMFSSMYNESAGLRQKLGSLTLQNQLLMAIADGSVCTKMLTEPSPKHFNATNLIDHPPKLQLTEIPISTALGAPMLARLGQNASILGQDLFVSDIYVGEIEGTGDRYKANLRIVFDETKLRKSLQPIGVGLILRTTGPIGNKRIVYCASATGGNCVPSIDPLRPWLKASIVCPTDVYDGITAKTLTLSTFENGTVRYVDYQNDDPVTINYNADTGAYVSISGDKHTKIQAACLQNLKDVIQIPQNQCP